jgi:hypothetical protein
MFAFMFEHGLQTKYIYFYSYSLGMNFQQKRLEANKDANFM